MRQIVATLTVIAIQLLATPVFGGQDTAEGPPRLKVFLDCNFCHQDYLRAEVEFVDFVRDRKEADVHVLVTSLQTGGGGREYTMSMTGLGRIQGTDHTLRTLTNPSDAEDTVRRQLATTLRVGLLRYLTRDAVPQQLSLDVELGSDRQQARSGRDPWNNWVFSLRGSASVEGEESNRELQLNGRVGADRITENWKITFGGSFDHERQEFDLDEDDPVSVERREREFSGLAVKSLTAHWSVGAGVELVSSTFSNNAFQGDLAAAVEYNIFPYAEYTRRQLRLQYLLGLRRARYNEETLFGKLRETRGRQEMSAAFERTERWGSLDMGIEFSQYLHDLSKYRLETDAEISWRVARGFSISAEGRASRIRDQLSLPRRGATSEEILLRLRQLRSGYDYDLRLSLTYSFGSIFSAVVNPRFGQ